VSKAHGASREAPRDIRYDKMGLVMSPRSVIPVIAYAKPVARGCQRVDVCPVKPYGWHSATWVPSGDGNAVDVPLVDRGRAIVQCRAFVEGKTRNVEEWPLTSLSWMTANEFSRALGPVDFADFDPFVELSNSPGGATMRLHSFDSRKVVIMYNLGQVIKVQGKEKGA